MKRYVIHPTGAVEALPGQLSYEAIADLIDATLLNHFRLPDGRIVFVDESGHPKRLPLNPEATKLCQSAARPGTRNTIAGAAVVVPGTDFSDDDI